MQFEAVRIADFPPFRDFQLALPPGVTVIAGANGVGKSRLLTFLARRKGPSVLYGRGSPDVDFRDNQDDGVLIRFDTQRMFPALSRHYPRPYSMRYSGSGSASGLSENFSVIGDLAENWFIQMNSFNDHSNVISSESKGNFELFKKIISVMDSRYKFLKISDDFEIVLQTPQGPLNFNQTSSGFQSAFLLLLGVVFGVESLTDGAKAAKDFDGCILIDEVDAHLHPSWQRTIIRKLQEVVPHAQIIATTHSPHVIQSLTEHELVVLTAGPDGLSTVKQISPTPGPYGFQGWTVEEILHSVMGVEDTLSTVRDRAEAAFNDALDNDDVDAAAEPYEELMSMLHPSNPLREIYAMQYKAAGGVQSQ
jgi:AAA domain, putative AbiEii toxin, Type IV TA system